MPRKGHTEEQIVGMLRQNEAKWIPTVQNLHFRL